MTNKHKLITLFSTLAIALTTITTAIFLAPKNATTTKADNEPTIVFKQNTIYETTYTYEQLKKYTYNTETYKERSKTPINISAAGENEELSENAGYFTYKKVICEYANGNVIESPIEDRTNYLTLKLITDTTNENPTTTRLISNFYVDENNIKKYKNNNNAEINQFDITNLSKIRIIIKIEKTINLYESGQQPTGGQYWVNHANGSNENPATITIEKLLNIKQGTYKLEIPVNDTNDFYITIIDYNLNNSTEFTINYYGYDDFGWVTLEKPDEEENRIYLEASLNIENTEKDLNFYANGLEREIVFTEQTDIKKLYFDIEIKKVGSIRNFHENFTDWTKRYYAPDTPQPEAATEVIDIGGVMLQILAMPFTFISKAFNVTIFPNTPYQINFANMFKGLIAILTIMFIIKIFTSGFSVLGNYTSNHQDRKWTKEQRQMQRENHKMQIEKHKKDMEK